LVLVIGFAIYIVLPQIGELEQALVALRSGRWRYLWVTLAGTLLTFVGAGWMVEASTSLRLPFGRTILGQVAASFMATVTPARLGWVVVTQGYLRKAGADEHTAYAASTLNMLITVGSHVALLLALLPLLPSLDLLLVAAGMLLWLPKARRKILADLLGLLRAMPAVVAEPRRSLIMVLGAVTANVGFAVALAGSVAAFGPVPSFLGILVAYMLAATLSAVAPTPGGLGAMEAALVTALVRLGVEPGAAVASVLTFRLATFWLPIPVGGWVLRRGRREGWL
jgi:uncharacterized membrane protein YbhN (UPF0104 family)